MTRRTRPSTACMPGERAEEGRREDGRQGGRKQTRYTEADTGGGVAMQLADIATLGLRAQRRRARLAGRHLAAGKFSAAGGCRLLAPCRQLWGGQLMHQCGAQASPKFVPAGEGHQNTSSVLCQPLMDVVSQVSPAHLVRSARESARALSEADVGERACVVVVGVGVSSRARSGCWSSGGCSKSWR